MKAISYITHIKRNKTRVLSILLSTLVMGLYQNCGQAHFSNYASSGNNVGTCTQVLTQSQKQLRIIFMVDNSGSTNTTDPNKYYRLQTVNRFIQDFGYKQNLSYAYGLFSGTTGTFFDSTQNTFQLNAASPFGNANHLTAALNAFSAMSALSSTPYAGAFTALNTIITNSLLVANNPKDFIVVFMSDGQPTDLSSPQAPRIVQLVKDLRTAAQSRGGSVNVSSVYFGSSSDGTAVNNMQVMAQEGQGQFINTNQTGGQLLIDDLIVIPGESCL